MPITVCSLERGDGWFALVDDLCTKLQARAKAGGFEQPTIAQFKEKLEKLQVYLTHDRPEYDALIYEARYRALMTCVICGAPSVQKGVDAYARYCGTHEVAHGAGAWMSPALDDLLCKRYPAIFAARHRTATKTSMCLGFACNDGCFNIDRPALCSASVRSRHGAASRNRWPPVKQKFGEPRSTLG